MAKILRTVLTVGAGALAYKVLTKEKIMTDRNVTNGTIGAVTGMVGIPELEKIVKGNYDSGTKTMRNVVIGSLAGAGISYFLSSGKSSDAANYARGFYKRHLSAEEEAAAKPEEK